jgi:hypothetical protein
LSIDQFIYKYPLFDLKVEFSGRLISATVPSSIRKVTVGVILVQRQLRNRINDAIGSRLPTATVDGLVSDCYDLIIQFIRGLDERQYCLDVTPHIYAASPSQFGKLISTSSSIEVTLDAIAAAGATQII